MRAKDKEFNAEIKTDFDKSIGKINIIPQDIGRVLLNLFNNAFYAVNEKLKAESLTQNAEYKPTVVVTTKKINNAVEIKIFDNGNGIPQNIVDKIFQPFFTVPNPDFVFHLQTFFLPGHLLNKCFDVIAHEVNLMLVICCRWMHSKFSG